MKSLRTVWLGLAIAGALLAGTAAMAQGPGGGMGMGAGRAQDSGSISLPWSGPLDSGEIRGAGGTGQR